MYFNVVVKDDSFVKHSSNQLVFTFESVEDAVSFAKEILLNSNYHIEILQFEDKEK